MAKRILPEASNVWIKAIEWSSGFRWRDPNLQVITLLRLMSEQLL